MKLVRFNKSGKRMPQWGKDTSMTKKWSMTYSGEYYDWTLASVKLGNLSGLML